MATAASRRFSPRLSLAAFLLGLALGGFFDGILLHQILQWHHLLSGLEEGAFQDLSVQLLADGLFHALMYLIAMVGLVLLWKDRSELNRRGKGKLLLAYAAIGFGSWHVLDSVVSHWLLGIHRVRMDAENPLFWDLLWFLIFGVGFIIMGCLLYRRSGEGDDSPKPVVGMLVLALAIMAPLAAIPPQQESKVLVFFKQNTRGSDVFRAADAAGARIIWASIQGNVWVMDVPDKRRRSHLAEYGAYWIVDSSVLLGCLAWTRS